MTRRQPSPDGATDSSVARRPRLGGLLGLAIGVAGLGAVWLGLRVDGAEMIRLLAATSPGLALAAVGGAALSMGLVGWAWQRVLGALGQRVALGPLLRAYYVGSMGKYVPGGVWPVLGRGELAVAAGSKRPAAYLSVGLSMLLAYGAAAAVVVGLLPWGMPTGPIDGTRPVSVALWALAILPLVGAMLHPRLGGRLLQLALGRFSPREDGTPDAPMELPGLGRLAGLVLLHLPVWFVVGLTQFALVGTVVTAAGLEPPGFLVVLWASALSWLAGFAVLPVPGGIGIREAIFVAALPMLPPEVALGAALLCRAAFVLGDTGAAGIALLTGGRTAG